MSNEDREPTVFEEAIKTFDKTFTEQEKKDFSAFENVKTMKNYVLARAKEHDVFAQGPFRQFYERITALSNSLNPYFAIITAFVQSDPRIAGLLWGSLLLVFKLSENYSSFLDKFNALLDSICIELSIFTRRVDMLKEWNIYVEKRLAKSNHSTNGRLFKALSDLYTDLIDMCRYVISLLTTPKVVQRLKLRAKLAWKPFDEHFSQFLTRMNRHKTVLELELEAMAEEKCITVYEEIEKDASRARKQGEDILHNIERTKVEDLKSWLNSPPWQAALEVANLKRSPGTTSWILESEEYKRWQGNPTVDSADKNSSGLSSSSGDGHLLFLQAKPGYGKTVLCATITEHCKSQDRANRSTAFYFFDQRDEAAAVSSSAFRAVVTQLLHHHRNSRVATDLAMVMKYSKGSGQITASDSETKELLALYLEHFPGTILIFDGIDECKDYDRFLQDLDVLTIGKSCKVLLSCRPTISFDGILRNFGREHVPLDEVSKLQDIERYVRPEIQRLFDEKELDETESLDEIVSQISRRSNSMFLWANLMVTYLRSDFLTPEDRHEAISELNTFEDLDDIYIRILQRLKLSCKGAKAWKNIERLFHWVFISIRPLQQSELQVALAINVGKPISKRRYITKFSSALMKLSGALIETTADKTVRFIHLSVKEFFAESAKRSQRIQGEVPHPLMLFPHIVHGSIALDCLSYILYCIPGEPLSGNPANKATVSQLLKEYPMSLYATQHWSWHAHQAVTSADSRDQIYDQSRNSLITMIKEFFSSKFAVSVWTEASWTFGAPPQLYGLSIDELKDMLVPFQHDLLRLERQWGYLLRDAPNEIWNSSIPAFMQSRFWVETDNTRVISLKVETTDASSLFGLDGQPKPITIASENSSDGSRVGIIQVTPCRLFEKLSCQGKHSILQCSRHWMMNYSIVGIQDQKCLLSVNYELPEDNVFIINRRASRSASTRFPFPTSISRDLHDVAILGCILRLVPESINPQISYAHYFQNLIFLKESRESSPNPEISFFSQSIKISDLSSEGNNEDDWYQTKFSPSGKYFLAVRGPMKFGTKDSIYKEWHLTVYGDSSSSDAQPNFQCLGKKTTRAFSAAGRNFIFHPSEPVLAISRLGNVILWYFGTENSRTHVVADQPLTQMQFSDSGDLLLGKTVYGGSYNGTRLAEDDSKSEMLAIPFTSQLGSSQNVSHSEVVGGSEAATEHSLDLVLRTTGQVRSNLNNNLPSVVRANEPVITCSNGKKTVSLLEQNDSEIIFHQMEEKGDVARHSLSRTPLCSELLASRASLVALPLTTGEDNRQRVGIIVNKEEQDTYDSTQVEEVQLPLLITKTVDSITTTHGKRSSNFLESSEEKRQRIGW